MNIERLHETFLELVAVESPSFHERAMAARCAAVLETLGFDVRFDDAGASIGSDTGNLIAMLPGTAPGRVAFSAHLDTVKPCEGIEVAVEEHPEHGKIYVSAAETILSADDKAGIAAIFEGVRAALESGRPRPDIYVLLTVCEEQSLLGSGALAADALPEGIDCFVLDADGCPGTVISGAPCHYTLRASFAGRAAHAGVEPEAGISAIVAASDAVVRMELGRLDEATTANVGVIAGGVAANVVPSECRLEGECRSLYRQRADEVRAQMTRSCEEAAAAHGAACSVSWELDYPEILYAQDDPLIVRLSSAIECAGLTPRLHHTGGGSDANMLGGKGVRAIALGIGMTNFHSVDEFISHRDLEDSAKLVAALIFEYAG